MEQLILDYLNDDGHNAISILGKDIENDLIFIIYRKENGDVKNTRINLLTLLGWMYNKILKG